MQQSYAAQYTTSSRQRYRQSPRARRRRRKRLVRRLAVTVLILVLCALAVFAGIKSLPKLLPQLAASEAAENAALAQELQERQDIPQSLLDLAGRNPEATAFVAGWPGEGQAGDTRLSVTTGQIPQLLQWDTRWGYESYGDDYMAVTGCAPTCLAMVAAGLTGNEALTPLYVAQMAESNGYYMPGTGTSWDIMTGGAALLGVNGTELSLTKGSIDAYLADGLPIICSVRPGDFTTAGHFIVLAGYAEDGNYRVYDPNSPQRSTQSWSYEQLEPQIKNLWGYSAA